MEQTGETQVGVEETAVKVQVDPGSYAGSWLIYPVTPHTKGKKAVELTEGRAYRLCIADDWFGGVRFRVEAGGRIEPLDPDAHAEKVEILHMEGPGDVAVFRFRTTRVAVDHNGFEGRFGFGRAGNTTPDDAELTVVKDTLYHVAAGVWNNSVVRVNAEGHFEAFAPCSGHSFRFEEHVLALDPVPIRIDAGGFEGIWRLEFVCRGQSTQQVLLVPMFTYRLSLNQGTWPYDAFAFYVDSCGNVVPHHSDSDAWHSAAFLDGSCRGLRLRTTTCRVEVDRPATWRIPGVGQDLGGAFELVTNCTYRIEVKAGDAPWAEGRFRVEKDGTLEPASLSVGGHAVTLSRVRGEERRLGPWRDLRLSERPSSPLDVVP